MQPVIVVIKTPFYQRNSWLALTSRRKPSPPRPSASLNPPRDPHPRPRPRPRRRLGSAGLGRFARKVLGSTADTLARKAHCPVAIVGTDHDVSAPSSGWVTVAADDSPSNDVVLEHGFREARLRKAPILALGDWRWEVGGVPYHQLDCRLDRWVSQYPDVHVRPAAARRAVVEFLVHTDEPVQLAVIGSRDAGDVARIIGPVTHALLDHAYCSVLVVH